MRNQRLNAPQVTHQLEPGGSGLESNAHPHDLVVRGTSEPGHVAGREATVNACGVAVAMLQGQSWAPRLSNDPQMNVGTAPTVPWCPPARVVLMGKARCRLMPLGWGGGPVVVRAQESCAHGEGAQRTRCLNLECQEPPVNTGEPLLYGGLLGTREGQLPVGPQGAASAMGSWRARCGESRTPGSASGQEKPTHRKMVRALLADSTLVGPLPGQRPAGRREGPLPTDAVGMGRRTRSSPSQGKPGTWRRGPACSQRGC